jgi:hypothetical protein
MVLGNAAHREWLAKGRPGIDGRMAADVTIECNRPAGDARHGTGCAAGTSRAASTFHLLCGDLGLLRLICP